MAHLLALAQLVPDVLHDALLVDELGQPVGLLLHPLHLFRAHLLLPLLAVFLEPDGGVEADRVEHRVVGLVEPVCPYGININVPVGVEQRRTLQAVVGLGAFGTEPAASEVRVLPLPSLRVRG